MLNIAAVMSMMLAGVVHNLLFDFTVSGLWQY
jgi:hypothetical protein